jgi:hypothetical protein
MAKFASKSITAENTYSDAIDVRGAFQVSISGTWAATVTLQRQIDGSNWRDVDNYSANAEVNGEDKAGANYRIGVKTGGFTSGTVVVYIRAE